MKTTLHKLGILMAVLLASLTASAYDFEVDGIYYTIISLDDMTLSVSGCKSDITELSIPGTLLVNGRSFNVKSIEDKAFMYRSIESVSIGIGVKELGVSVFSDCSKLKSFDLGEVSVIPYRTFANCKALTEITIQSAIDSIGSEAFINGPNTILHINCGERPLVSCGEDVFIQRPIIQLEIDRNIKEFGNVWEELSSTYIGENLTEFPSYLGALVGQIDFNKFPNIEAIDDYAFAHSWGIWGIRSVIFSDNIKTIGKWAFKDDELSDLILPESIVELGEGAFSGNPITNLVLSSSLKEIPESCFASTAIESIIIPYGIETIRNKAFSFGYNGCEIDLIQIPASVNLIEGNAFPCSSSSNAKLIIEDGDNILSIEGYKESSELLEMGYYKNDRDEALASPFRRLYTFSSPFSKTNWKDVYLGRMIFGIPLTFPAYDNNTDEFNNDRPTVRYYAYNNILEYLPYMNSNSIDNLSLGLNVKQLDIIEQPSVIDYTCRFIGFYTNDEYIVSDTTHYAPMLDVAKLEKLKQINCHSNIPPTVENDFPTGVYISAVVNVPVGSKEAYENAPIWKNFGVSQKKISPMSI